MLNAVGIDVSKGKSTVAVLRPAGEIVHKPFNVTHTREELTSNRHSVEELCELIGADTLGFLDKDSLGELIGACEKTYCDACFTGDYPEK